MLTFAQYLKEDDFAGWASPTGSIHQFHYRDEHSMNHHPAIAKAVHTELKKTGQQYETNPSLAAAMKRGYARIRHESDRHIIHFDKDAKGGKQAALHGLKHLKPGLNSRILVSHKPWNNTDDDIDNEHEFKSQAAAAAHIRKI